MIDEGRLLGRGVHFPPRIDAEGRWAWSSGEENIRQSIRILLQTEPLERLMLPEFGGGLKKMLFRPNTASTHRLMEEIITNALKRWEPRIVLNAVDIQPDPDDPDAANVTIRYTLASNDQTEQMRLRVLLKS